MVNFCAAADKLVVSRMRSKNFLVIVVMLLFREWYWIPSWRCRLLADNHTAAATAHLLHCVVDDFPKLSLRNFLATVGNFHFTFL